MKTYFFSRFQPDISDKSISEATGSAGYSLDILFFSYYMYFPPFTTLRKLRTYGVQLCSSFFEDPFWERG